MKTLTEQPEKKLEESYETTRDIAITAGLHMWAHLEARDEFIAIELKWTCVGILGRLNWSLFWGVSVILIISLQL